MNPIRKYILKPQGLSMKLSISYNNETRAAPKKAKIPAIGVLNSANPKFFKTFLNSLLISI